ncbi:MAG: SET domain-containing protein-lysine N-methyltransferase [Xanthomonadales bacterium]|nr:SET domain-containing protein-lysine N-methyltransferase [Xanthomonadales bacterium]
MRRRARFDRNPRARVDRSEVHGRGLFARAPIGAGDYIGRYDGATTEDDGTHVLWVEQDDGRWVGIDGDNEMRFLNHSDTPNAEFDGLDCYALTDIAPDEEILIDYGPWFTDPD